MTRSLGRRSILPLVAAAALALVGVAGGFGASDAQKRGGTLKLISSGDVDSVDPGQTYYSFGWQVLAAAHRPLYSVPANSTKTVPDLAAAMPKISADGRTVTVQIKRGIRFSPPVNREVTAADVKYAIERTFASSVPNGYAYTYFTDLVGAPANPPKTPKPISGLQTNGKYTLLLKLKVPSTTIVGALVMTNTAPVPKEYAVKFDNKTTSDYAFHQVASGPYMFEADSSGNIQGKGYTPGKSMHLVRNPNWSAKTDYRPAYVDDIEVQEGFTDVNVGVRRILNGEADGAGDYANLPATLMRDLSTNGRYKDNFYTWPNGTAYIVMNTTKKPFDDVHVRRAASYVLDRNAIRLAGGGPISGSIATHFVGPEFRGRGFEEAGGFKYNPYPSKNFSGDVTKAKAEMRKAGYADGMYSGPDVTAIVSNSGPSSAQAKILAASLAKIGIKVNLKLVSIDAMFTKFCVVPKNEPELCPSVAWLPDFKDPVTMLDPTFNGKNIVPTNNVNMSLLDDPTVNRAIEKAKRIRSVEARYAAWGRVDRMIMERAAVIPVLWTNVPNVVSDRIVPAKSLANTGLLDLATTSIK